MKKIFNKMFRIYKTDNHICITVLGIKMFFKYKEKNIVEKYEIAGEGNKIYIKENGILREAEKKVPGLEIELSGINNTIIIEFPTCFINSRIVCNGNNGEIIIEKTNKKFIDLLIYMSSNFDEKPLRNRKVHIKQNVSSGAGGGFQSSHGLKTQQWLSARTVCFLSA